MLPTPWERATSVCVGDVASEVLRRAREVLPAERALGLTDTPCGRINGAAHPDNISTLVVGDRDAVPAAVESAAATLEALGVRGSFAVAVWPRSCIDGAPEVTPRVLHVGDPEEIRRH